MKKYICIVILTMLGLLTACQSPKTVKTSENKTSVTPKEQPHVIVEKFEGESLKNNMIEENVGHNLTVYLTPSYYTSNKKYPVVYFLHGFQETPNLINGSKEMLDMQMKVNENNEFILVEPDAYSKLKGSFYVNSPVIGNREDYIVKDVVSFVDKKYRTIPKESSRGIAGFSMCGFGALNIGMKLF